MATPSPEETNARIAALETKIVDGVGSGEKLSREAVQRFIGVSETYGYTPSEDFRVILSKHYPDLVPGDVSALDQRTAQLGDGAAHEPHIPGPDEEPIDLPVARPLEPEPTEPTPAEPVRAEPASDGPRTVQGEPEPAEPEGPQKITTKEGAREIFDRFGEGYSDEKDMYNTDLETKGNIQDIQQLMNANGSDLAVDGDFGPLTATAWLEFCEEHGIDPKTPPHEVMEMARKGEIEGVKLPDGVEPVEPTVTMGGEEVPVVGGPPAELAPGEEPVRVTEPVTGSKLLVAGAKVGVAVTHTAAVDTADIDKQLAALHDAARGQGTAKEPVPSTLADALPPQALADIAALQQQSTEFRGGESATLENIGMAAAAQAVKEDIGMGLA